MDIRNRSFYGAIRSDSGAIQICETLSEGGFEAYLVGGCVRDAVMGATPSDWDIATSATPGETLSLFEKAGVYTVPTGVKHGTVTVVWGEKNYEVTTFRADGTYSDGRHPDSVEFSQSIDDDLARRDFTVNAMAYSEKAGLIDPFDGLGDIKAGIIRTVGDPLERFREDGLRMMRAVRFAAKLGFEIDRDTLDAVTILAPRINSVSAERIAAELVGTLVAPHPEFLRLFYDTGLLGEFLPELMLAFFLHDPAVPPGAATAADVVLRALPLSPDLPAVRTAILLTGILGTDDIGRAADAVLGRLRFPSAERRRIARIVGLSNRKPNPAPTSVKRLLAEISAEYYDDYEAVISAICRARDFYRGDTGELKKIEDTRRAAYEVITSGEPYLISHLAIDGDDVSAFGYSGNAIGVTLRSCLEHVIQHPEDNTLPRLTEFVRGLREEQLG